MSAVAQRPGQNCIRLAVPYNRADGRAERIGALVNACGVPDLYGLIFAAGGQACCVRRPYDTAHRGAMTGIGDGVLLAGYRPDSGGLVARAGDELAAVGRPEDAGNNVAMAAQDVLRVGRSAIAREKVKTSAATDSRDCDATENPA